MWYPARKADYAILINKRQQEQNILPKPDNSVAFILPF